MISVPFELELVAFGMLIPVTPLPEMFQKECSVNLIRGCECATTNGINVVLHLGFSSK